MSRLIVPLKTAKKQYWLLTAFILAILLLTPACKQGTSSNATNGEIAARVGNVDISLSKVDRIIDQGLQGAEKKLSTLTPVELATARLKVLDTLIAEEVLFQRARQENIQISDEEVRSQIQKEIEADGLSSDEFQKQLKSAGLTNEEYNEKQRRQMVITKLQDKISIVKPPTDREIKDYYDNNQSQFILGRGVSLSAIIVDAADNKAKNDAIGEEQAKKKIQEIYTQLKSGADFATVARVQSEDQSAIKGGDLGFLGSEALQQTGFPPQLVQAFLQMREGDITPVMEVGSGRSAIFKLTSKRLQDEKLTLDSPQVKSQISQLLTSKRKEVLNTALLSGAVHQVRIENYLAQRMLKNPDNFGSLRPTLAPNASEGNSSNSNNPKPSESKENPDKPSDPETKPSEAGKPESTPPTGGK